MLLYRERMIRRFLIKYSAMMVYGNLGVSELPEDRDGFTGMILEKNWDKELYRFVGYKDGDSPSDVQHRWEKLRREAEMLY